MNILTKYQDMSLFHLPEIREKFHAEAKKLKKNPKEIRNFKRRVNYFIKKQLTHQDPIINAELIERYQNWMLNSVVCGFHSGFPPCCIKHFLSKWMWACIDSHCSYFPEYHEKMEAKRTMKKVGKGFRYNFEYIPCPTCLENETFVKCKKCPKGTCQR